jgi:GntR family transcriptional regulator, transcriptional repressor for pyruvate dehydrogenase complex
VELEVIERSRLSDAVARKIKQYIAAGGLAPGDRLPTEHALAEQLGVSRVSVREVTKALEFLGILEARPGRGITVGRLDMGRVSEFLGFHLAINHYPAIPLIETRIVIETGGLPYAARRMAEDPTIYDRLQGLVERFRGTRELQGWIDLDIAFHRALLEASGLGPLVAFNDLLQVFFQRFRESVKKAEWKRGIDSHQRIIDSLREQDLTAACEELRRHIESHKERVGVRS